jgi:hypothetical protein
MLAGALAEQRTESTIAVKGRFNGRAFEKSFDTGGAPWYQYQELSFDAFGAGPVQGIVFATNRFSSSKASRNFSFGRGCGSGSQMAATCGCSCRPLAE